MDANTELADKIGRYDWFHTIDFGNGVVSKGHCTADVLKAKADCYFSWSPKGKTVLDIGCWDGYFSLEALRRGASRVVATDHYVWHSKWDRGTFDLVRERLAPELEVKDIDVCDISPSTVGTFDFVLLTGVLYHTRHPLLALERAASVCTDVLVVETVLDAARVPRPAMVFYPGLELKQDSSNWWGPNRLCVEAMLRDVGFADIAFTPTPIPRKWTVFDWVKHNPKITSRFTHAEENSRASCALSRFVFSRQESLHVALAPGPSPLDHPGAVTSGARHHWCQEGLAAHGAVLPDPSNHLQRGNRLGHQSGPARLFAPPRKLGSPQ